MGRYTNDPVNEPPRWTRRWSLNLAEPCGTLERICKQVNISLLSGEALRHRKLSLCLVGTPSSDEPINGKRLRWHCFHESSKTDISQMCCTVGTSWLFLPSNWMENQQETYCTCNGYTLQSMLAKLVKAHLWPWMQTWTIKSYEWHENNLIIRDFWAFYSSENTFCS